MKKIKILALFLALITSGVLFWFLSQNGAQAVEIPKQNVVVAASNIPENTMITADMIRLSAIPTELVLPTSYDNPTDMIGKTTRYAIVEGEQIITTRLVEVGSSDSGSLAYTVTPGMRAITVGVNDTSSLKCMIHPGDYVDIIAHYQIEKHYINSEGEDVIKDIPEAKILLQQILVLAVDQTMLESGTEAYTTLTLEVTPDQAVEASLTEMSGLLRAILRSPLDEETVQSEFLLLPELAEGL